MTGMKTLYLSFMLSLLLFVFWGCGDSDNAESILLPPTIETAEGQSAASTLAESKVKVAKKEVVVIVK